MVLNIKNRLKKVADFVEYKRLADIGSDHAYLPIYLAKHKKIDFAIAGEVVAGPHKSSLQNVEDNGFSNIISCRKGSGLSVINSTDFIECITICGMGGKLIADILEEGKEKLSTVKELILQPNVAAHLVRQKLEDLDYKIVAEDILEEDGHIYEIIVAKKGRMSLNFEEKTFGIFLPQEKNPAFIKKYEQELKKLDYILEELKKSNQENNEKKIIALQSQKNMIKNILK